MTKFCAAKAFELHLSYPGDLVLLRPEVILAATQVIISELSGCFPPFPGFPELPPHTSISTTQWVWSSCHKGSAWRVYFSATLDVLCQDKG